MPLDNECVDLCQREVQLGLIRLLEALLIVFGPELWFTLPWDLLFGRPER